MLNLSGYRSIRTALFVRIQIDEYRVEPGDSFTSEVLLFSDHNSDYTINSEVYENLGNFINISSSKSELRATSDNLTITIAGIPIGSVKEIINSKIKSSPVTVYRGYFDNSTNALIGTIQGKFKGIINNYSLIEELDFDTRSGTASIQLECTSNIEILGNKVSGRKTNPISMKKFYNTDSSFDRVPTLENTTFDFGGS